MKENATVRPIGARNPNSPNAPLSFTACAATMADTDNMIWKRLATATQIQPCRMRRRPARRVKSPIQVQITNTTQAIGSRLGYEQADQRTYPAKPASPAATNLPPEASHHDRDHSSDHHHFLLRPLHHIVGILTMMLLPFHFPLSVFEFFARPPPTFIRPMRWLQIG